MRERLIPASPDFLWEFARRVLARADSIGGVGGILASFYFQDDPLQTVLRSVGAFAVAWGAYDVFREERVTRRNREQLVSVEAHLQPEWAGGLSFEALQASPRVTGISNTVNFSIHAQKSDIRTRGLLLRIYEVYSKRRWWWPFMDKELETVLATLQPKVSEVLNAPRTLAAHGEPWEGTTYFSDELTDNRKSGNRGMKYRGRLTARLVLVTNAPAGAEFLSDRLEFMSLEDWED